MEPENERRTRIILLGLVFSVGITGSLWFLLAQHGPLYNGKPLAFWLNEWGSVPEVAAKSPENRTKREQAVAAIQNLGTNALPTLLRMAGKKDSALKKRMIVLLNKQPIAALRIKPGQYRDYRCKAAYGLAALGPAAQPAVPGLLHLLRDPDPEVRASAGLCLNHLRDNATNAVPSLIQAFNQESDQFAIFMMMYALQSIHTSPDLAVPSLLEYLDGPHTSRHREIPAMLALQGYGAQAKPAVPAILPYLTDQDPNIRDVAEMALSAIDPQALDEAKQKMIRR